MSGVVLYHGDALDVMAEMEPRSVNLILSDLPYGTTRNTWDSIIPLGQMWDGIKRVLSPDGVVVLTSQGLFTARLQLSNERWFRYKYVWVKSKATNFLNAKKQPLRKHEDVCVFYPGGPTYNPQMASGEAYDKGTRKNQNTGSYGSFEPVRVSSDGARYPTDVLYFATAESEGRVWHPTQKPVALGQWYVRTYTNPGDLVLDFASGSGSFVVAAASEGRRCIGVERWPDAKAPDGEAVNLLEVTRNRLLSAGYQGTIEVR